MPRVYTRTAGKDYPQQGIAKGDTYYAWSFYRQAERKSKTYPKASQLTNISSHQTVYAAFEFEGELDGPDALRDIISQLEEAKSEEEEKQSNLESANLQDGERGQAVSNNIYALDSAISDLETIADEWEEFINADDTEDGEDDEDEKEPHEHADRDWTSEVRDLQPEME